jgi:hypothetical protein
MNRFSDIQSKFADRANPFPDLPQKFPVRWLRELAAETRRISSLPDSSMAATGAQNREIACIFPWSREIDVETGSLETGPSATLSHCFCWSLCLSWWIRNRPEFPPVWGGRIGQRGIGHHYLSSRLL